VTQLVRPLVTHAEEPRDVGDTEQLPGYALLDRSVQNSSQVARLLAA
jgi:hypothetical protein